MSARQAPMRARLRLKLKRTCQRWLHRGHARLSKAVGGPARLRVIALLACVLALEAADSATVGAVATPLEQAFHVSNAGIGLMVTLSSAIGIGATLPVGILVDRRNRTRLLTFSVLLWCSAELAGSMAQSYLWLLLTRVALGAVVATAGPAVASLVGDYFEPAERGRIWGFVLTGELVGAGIGILVSGDLGALSWRISFAWLIVPGLAIAYVIWRYLPEPTRGGQSRMAIGTEAIPSPVPVSPAGVPQDASAAADASVPGAGDIVAEPEAKGIVEEEVLARDIPPREELVLRSDPTPRTLWWAVRYVLSIPTNRRLILASALGYFYFDGLRTFAVEYLRGRYGLGQAAASTLLIVIGIGAVVGVLVSGRVADRLVRAGVVSGRVWVAAVAFMVAVIFLLVGLLTGPLISEMALAFVGAAGLGGANPPLDAARLDIMHSRLWGRAESVRTALQASFQAIAPLLFGFVSTKLGSPTSELGRHSGVALHNAQGLHLTFIIMLVPAFAAAVILFTTRRTYPKDVATAVASEQATSSAAGPETTGEAVAPTGRNTW